MKCLRCGFKNAATVGYCQQCGGKIDFTAAEIQGALATKEKDERAAGTGQRSRRLLFYAVVVFLLSLLMFIVSGGARSDASALPSIVDGTRHVEVDYSIDERLKLPKGLVPFAAKRR